MKKTLRILTNSLALVASGRAVTISIVNGDFETGGLADNSNSAFPGVIPTGWSAVPGAGPGGVFFGYYNPVDDPGGYISDVSGNPGVERWPVPMCFISVIRSAAKAFNKPSRQLFLLTRITRSPWPGEPGMAITIIPCE